MIAGGSRWFQTNEVYQVDPAVIIILFVIGFGGLWLLNYLHKNWK
jgi:hypothetical protein